MEEKARIVVKDAASLNKTFHRLGFPQTAEVSITSRSHCLFVEQGQGQALSALATQEVNIYSSGL